MKSFSFKLSGSFLGIYILLTLISIIFFQGCGPSSAKKDLNRIDPGFSAYISGYTGGVVSIATPITIQLAQLSVLSQPSGEPVSEKIFQFDPDIPGKAIWIDEYTLEFQPEERLRSGTEYTVKILLDKVMEVPEDFKVFTYSFRTISQNFDVIIEGLVTPNPKDLTTQQLTGNLLTADIGDAGKVEKILSVVQEGNPLAMEWIHSPDLKSHRFIASGIKRSERASSVDIKYDGGAMEIKKSGSEKVEVPSLSDFKLMNARVIHFPQQYLALQFSDPLQAGQDVYGLISIGELFDLDVTIDGNEIKVFPPLTQTGVKTVKISKGVKNILGYKLKNDQSLEVIFEQVKPAVRLLGRGVILPGSQGLVFPFEAVNLKAVDVSIIKIFENNITQFLQVNDLAGNYELQRVGYPVLRKTIPLTTSGVTDLGKWNRFTLDLAELIQSDPGSIYQITLGFTKAYSLYYCGEELSASGDGDTGLSAEMESWDTGSESSYWDASEDYYYYYPDGYDWEERENPCHVSYYTSDKKVKSNLLASDLGLMAKIGLDGNLMIVVNDLKTTSPLSGVTIEILNYQKQTIGSVTTDGEGMAKIELKKKPFLMIARLGDQRGYLKLDDGNALSISNFNVSGEKVQEGLKGFMYGERGVWRPGDSLHVAFILEDKNQLLPENHPVIFELYSPTGQLDKKIIRTSSLEGFYYFGTATDVNAPTGNWLGKVIVGGAEFIKFLKIEAIKPNRLKIHLDFGTDRLMAGDREIRGALQVKWLHGAPAGNLRAEFDVTLSKATTRFEKFPEYVFDDPARDFYSQTYTIFDDYLNSEGNASVPVYLSMEEAAPGMLNAVFKGRVYEKSGDFSVDMFTIPYYPYESFVGILTPKGDRARGLLLTDTTHQVSIVTVDPNGNGISRSGLTMEVYKLDWRWWWDNSTDYLGSYVNSSYYQPVIRQKINTSNGKGSGNFRINYPDWGRYLIRVSDPYSGHAAGKIVYVDWPGWAGRAQKEMPGGATMLSFSTDKESYQVKESIVLTIPGSGNGRALITIENGTRVLESHWMETRQGDNIFNIEVKEGFTPNVYIYVTLLQPHAQSVNDLPIRLYGILSVKVDNPATHLKPVISMADELKPESRVDIKVSESDGKRMVYTLAIVEDGLLDLTRFKTPDPWEQFYKKEGLGVKTWDLYDEVVGAYGGEIERLLALGGDEEIKSPEGSKANRFKPVVLYLGPYVLEKGKTNTHQVAMPAYIGSERTMIVAGSDGAYGFAEKSVPVRQSLMVLATLPRVLGPEEQVKLPVTVFSYDQKVKEVEVEIRVNEQLLIEGGNKKTVVFNQPGDQVVNFDLKVNPVLGIGVVEVNASSGNMEASDRIEIDIRNPNPPVTKVYESFVEPGKEWNLEFDNVGLKGTNKAVLEVSTLPPIDLNRRLNYLIQYPHGCVEQTTSSVFPQLYLSDVSELTTDQKEMISANVRKGIEKLRSFQNGDGGFRYWPDNTWSDDWSSSYVGHFLLEARKKGYNVPETMMKNWSKYQKRQSNLWARSKTKNSDLDQAYRLYTLALANEAQVGTMNRLREAGLSNAAAWRLAAAYEWAGLSEAARQITASLSMEIENYQELSYTYGSGLRDEAMILESLVLMKRRGEGMNLMTRISQSLSDPARWLSTQETAYSLLAVTAFASGEDRSKQIKISYNWYDGKQVNASTELPMVQKQLEIREGQKGKLFVKNTGSGSLFVRLLQEGSPSGGSEEEVSNGLSINVTFKDAGGNLIDISRIDQGDNLLAEVSIGNPGSRGDYQQLALSQIFSSGFEIVNERMGGSEMGYNADRPAYQDIRDDRVYSYFDLNSGRRKMIQVKLIATYAGRFYMPGVYCEAMYDHSINAGTSGKWIEIAAAENQ